MNVPPRGFWPVLGALRFLLAMWVLFDHTYNFGPADRAIPVLTRSGLMAVMCFFVISGFLITSHLLTRTPRTGRDFVDFWARRIRRLLPASLLVLAATVGFVGSVTVARFAEDRRPDHSLEDQARVPGTTDVPGGEEGR